MQEPVGTPGGFSLVLFLELQEQPGWLRVDTGKTILDENHTSNELMEGMVSALFRSFSEESFISGSGCSCTTRGKRVLVAWSHSPRPATARATDPGRPLDAAWHQKSPEPWLHRICGDR